MHKAENDAVKLQGIVDCSRMGSWEWNVQTGETVFNKTWAQIVGYTLDELAPVSIKTWESLAHPDDLEASGKLLERHFSGELSYYDFEGRTKHKDGHWVWVHDRGKVVSWSDDGKPLMMSGSHEDVAERRQAEEALQHTLAKAEQMNRLMSGREDRVLELKKEVNELLKKQGQEQKYGSAL